jgi:hypothetical protein
MLADTQSLAATQAVKQMAVSCTRELQIVSTTVTDSWVEANQRYLSAALAQVYALLTPEATAGDTEVLALDGVEPLDPPPAIERLCALFGFSDFERAVLLLCAGMGLDSRFAAACAAAHGDPRRTYPSFGLALATLPGAHWRALTPQAPLRYWRLVELSGGDDLISSRLCIDERILHYLTAVSARDERLTGFVEPVRACSALSPAQLALAERVAAIWSAVEPGTPLPAVQLCGPDPAGLRAVAWTACELLGLELAHMPVSTLLGDARELEALGRLWTREAALNPAALLLEYDDAGSVEPVREATLARLLEMLICPLLIASRTWRSSPHRPMLTLEQPRPTVAEQRRLWQVALGPATASLNGQLDILTTQFALSAPAIAAMATATLNEADAADELAGRSGRHAAARPAPVLTNWRSVLSQRPVGKIWYYRTNICACCARLQSMPDSATGCTNIGTSALVVPVAWASARCSAGRAAPARPWPPRCWLANWDLTCTRST